MPETTTILSYILVVIAAYLIGSIPTGVIVARLYRNVDVTQVGSQHTGATNVARALGPGAGAIVLVGDLAKGALAVWFATVLSPAPLAEGLAWLAAVLGHMRSLFLRGRGGRGVGTGLGGLAVIFPAIFALSIVSGSAIAGSSRYVSLGSLAGCVLATLGGVVAYLTGRLPTELLPFFLVTPLMVIWAHGDNIARLRAGQERRFGDRAQEPE